MLTVLPLASSLNPPAVVAATVKRVSERLAGGGIQHRCVTPDDTMAADLLLIVTGGTEHLALDVVERTGMPAFLLAHPDQNSLPAALEILGRLRQLGRRGRIFLLSEHADIPPDLARLGSHLTVRRRLQAARLGRIGRPSDWLVASTPAPELVRDVWGPTVVDVSMSELLDAFRHADPERTAVLAADAASGALLTVEPSASDLEAAARVSVALRAVVERHRLDACALRCFDLVVDHRTTGCLGVSNLLDDGTVAGCEGDVPATVTMLWAQLTTGEPAFMANPQDLDARSRSVWLAHCTVARRLVSGYSLRSHFESSVGVGIHGCIDPGEATVLRIGGAGLRDLFVADGQVVAHEDVTRRCRTQARVVLETNVERLLVEATGNHHVLVRGRHAQAFEEYHDLFVAGLEPGVRS